MALPTPEMIAAFRARWIDKPDAMIRAAIIANVATGWKKGELEQLLKERAEQAGEVKEKATERRGWIRDVVMALIGAAITKLADWLL